MTISNTESILDSLHKKIKQGTASDAEIGQVLLALEKWDYELFGAHSSGKRLLNRNNPHVNKFLVAAEKHSS
jgi:hypothetical protein